MSSNRDDFTKKTVDILAKRVGYICSNPKCRCHTVGPNTEKDKATIIGVAAHITAASPNGPRYDDSLRPDERKDIENGIWLCTNCSTLIDKDPKDFPKEILKEWKLSAENEISQKLQQQQSVDRPFIEADLIWSNSQRWNKGYSIKNKELYGNVIDFSKDIKPIIFWELIWNFKIALHNNSTSPAFNIKVEYLEGTNFSSIDKLAKVNNIPPYSNVKLSAKFETNLEGIHLEADKLLKNKIPDAIKGLKMKLNFIIKTILKIILTLSF